MTNPIERPWLRWLFGLAAALALFTGFGNMPLYGRYYVADWPGFGWTGDFIANVKVHYLAGTVLLGIGIYLMFVRILLRSRGVRLTWLGVWQSLSLWLAMLSGLIMAAKNLPEVRMDLPLLVAMNFTHMGTAMLFALVAVISLVTRGQWFKRDMYAA